MSIDITGIPQPRAEDARTVTKRVRLSDKEAEAYEKAAQEAGMTWSQMARWLFDSYIGKPVNPPVLPWARDAEKR